MIEWEWEKMVLLSIYANGIAHVACTVYIRRTNFHLLGHSVKETIDET